jgi:hypothetical protein
MKNQETAWGVFFSPKLIEHTVMRDNNKQWHPLAIFPTMTEAINYRAEKWMGKQTNEDGIQVKEVTINYELELPTPPHKTK